MPVSVRLRSVARTAFHRIADEIERLLDRQDVDRDLLRSMTTRLERRMEEIEEMDRAILEEMLGTEDLPEVDVDKETKEADDIAIRGLTLCTKSKAMLDPSKPVPVVPPISVVSQQPGVVPHRYKLPKIEMNKFGGEIKDWVPFWCLFKKIDADSTLRDEDKFHYLLQCITPGTRARKLVESYPPTGANYAKAVDALKARFGREDLLVEFYFRELLTLTLSFGKSKNRVSLADIYDQVETQLNALETLGVATNTFAMALFPLVESCLSEDQLRTWRRSEQASAESASEKLQGLLKFLEKEVQIEEAIRNNDKRLANQHIEKGKTNTSTSSHIPTAAELVANSSSASVSCVFCKEAHANASCKQAEHMTLQDRKKILGSNNCCFRCMRKGHRIDRCRVSLTCQVCRRRHATLMCFQDAQKSAEKKSEQHAENNLASTSPEGEQLPQVFLQTLVVVARAGSSKGKDRKIRVLFDTGSQHSYLRADLVDVLGYEPLGEVQLLHNLFGGSQTGIQKHKKYKVRLRSLDGSYLCNFDVLDQTTICQSVPTLKNETLSHELAPLGIKPSPDDGSPVGLLIGADIYGKLVTGRREILKSGLVGFETHLGWIVSGKFKEESSSTMMATTMFSMANPESVCNLWELDVLGIQDPHQQKTKEKRAEETHKFFLDTVRIDEQGRYEVRLPWIEDHTPIPRNFLIAKRRLDRTLIKLRETNMHTVYDKVFKEWLDEGVLERVDFEAWDKGHFLPHRPVFRDSNTTPVRPVFDASAQEKGYPSLNQCLETGVNLIEQIPKLLLIFRMNRIGVTSDIRKAFLQISLAEDDRDYLRFLWVKEDGSLQIYRHARVVFGVKSSPYLLGAVIDYHLCSLLESTRYCKEFIEQLRKSFYVDNCIGSVESKVELDEYMRNAIDIFREAKMDLRCWEFSDPSLERETISHVLGLLWDRKSDHLAISPSSWKAVDISKITRKTLISIAHRVFDPIGFCCPTTLRPKLLLQRCWDGEGGWQMEIPEELQVEFLSWYHELSYLENIRIPRWLTGTDVIFERSVHTFCDASKIAYSAVVYLRTVTTEGVFVHLIQAKSRVTPSTDITMPRLELLAALIGARLANSVKEVLGTDISYTFWSDSSTVITWINRDDNWGVFLHNRVSEIRSLSRKEDWRHVPGVLNPADLPSRGCSPRQLFESRWWEGPSWLREEEDSWPSEEIVVDESEIESERKKKGKSTVALFVVSADPYWFCSLSSDYEPTVRLVAWILRFVNNSRARKDRLPFTRGYLLCREIGQAEKFILRNVQQQSFSSVKDSKIEPLVAFVDGDGLMKLRTKVTERKDTYDFRFPILLPNDHVMVEKLVLSEHRRACHVGVQGLLSILRERFWILRGRQTVRSILTKCVNCARYEVKHAEALNPPLPEARTRDAEVFEVTGVDFFGPLILRDERKVYAVIFTCAVYRAVHLELAVSLSTCTFIQVLRRFIARRGRPAILYSDNARNFTGADAAFKRLDWDKLSKFCTTERIEWRFNPPSGPWWGGWWERLIGIIKQMLRKTLGKASVTYDELETLLCDCEATMNARPLTYVSEDDSDLAPITPNLFLRGSREAGVPDIDALSAAGLGERAQFIQKLRTELRKRFRNEYLGKLARTAKKVTRKLKIGEIVLFGSDDKKRIDWPLGRIIGFIPGNDGENRVVRLATANGEVMRPLQRVYPLEVCFDDQQT